LNATRYSVPRRRGERRLGGFVALLRVIALLAGLGLAGTGVGLIIAAAPYVVSPDSDIAGGVAFGLGGGASLAIGLALVRVAFRVLLQVATAIAGVALVIGGIELIIFAVPMSRMAAGEIDPERARLAMPVAGLLIALTGAALIAFVVARWLRNPQSRSRWPEVARWSAIVYGALLALSVGGAGAPAVAGGEAYTPTVLDAAFAGALLPLTALPGALLCYYGITLTSRLPPGRLRYLPAMVLLAGFAAAVALGGVVVAVEEPLVWLMTPAHAAAALLPAGALIAVAASGGLMRAAPVAGLTHRHAWLALATGIAVVTLVAGTLDSFIAQALATVVLAGSGAFDGLRSFEDVNDVFRFSDVYLSKGEEALLLVSIVVIMAPIMEEGFKGLGAALLMPRRPTPTAALTVGVAVGAGFGVFEASLYGLGGLVDDAEMEWWALMLLRGGATSMHALNTGLIGLALYFDREQGRLGRAFLLYLAAVALHGLWNALAVFAGSRVIFEFEGLTERELAMVSFGAMAPLGLITLGTLFAVARWCYVRSPKAGDAGEDEPAAAPALTFEPWLGWGVCQRIENG